MLGANNIFISVSDSSIGKVECAIGKSNNDKAPGVDSKPEEILKSDGKVVSQLMEIVWRY